RTRPFQTRGTLLRRDQAPRVREQIPQYRKQHAVEPPSKPAAPPLVPESDAIPRDQGVGIGWIGLYDHGPVTIRQCREDLVPDAEVGHIKVRTLDGFRKRKSEPTHRSQCDPTSTPHTTDSHH